MADSNSSRRWLFIGIGVLLFMCVCLVCALSVGGVGYVVVVRGGTQTAEAVRATETAIARVTGTAIARAEIQAATQTAAARPTVTPVASQKITVASDLPMTGSSAGQTTSIVNAIQLAFEEQNYQACNDTWTIEYQSFDDATAAAGRWDPAVVAENGETYVADENIVAVIGTYNSGAARILIPILNPVDLVMISPANTNPSLTIGPEAAQYYPNGIRNYARVSAADPFEGLVAAQWVSQLGVETVYIVDDGEAYGQGVADAFEQNASTYGLIVLGHDSIDGQATSYTTLARQIAATQPDLIFYGGITQNNAGQLFKDLRAADSPAQFMGADGILEMAFIDATGAEVAEGAYAIISGATEGDLPPRGQDFLDNYRTRYNTDPEAYAIYGYAAAQIVLDAFERVCASGQPLTDRAAVRDAVMSTTNFNTALGPVSFDENGDTTLVWMEIHQVLNGYWELVTSFAVERE